MENLRQDFNLLFENADLSYTVLPSGHGHKKIIITIDYNGQRKEFIGTTSDMQSTDEALREETSYDDAVYILYRTIQKSIEQEVVSWMADVDENFV